MQQFAEVAAAQDGGDDFKALVCVFLQGGNDAYNMLVPTAPGEYARYSGARGSLALQSAAQHAAIVADKKTPDLRRGPYLPLALDPSSPNTETVGGEARSFAIHPRMAEIQALFDAGNIAFIANIGTLSEPVTKAEYVAAVNGNGIKQIPNALFSHSDQVRQWRNGEPNRSVPDGWAGRFPVALSDGNDTQLPMHFSLQGNNGWQANDDRGTYVIGRNGSSSYLGQNSPDPTPVNGARYEAMVGGATIAPESSLAGASYTNAFKQHYADKALEAVAFYDEFSQHFDVTPFVDDPFSVEEPFDPDADTTLENRLAAVAATIAARTALGMKRQVFFVQLGGFDTHKNVLSEQAPLLDELSAALQKFWDDIELLGLGQDVVTFTASDFGRTLKRNGQGTDHGWGGHQLVMGGAVDGAKIFGSYPESLAVGGPADVETNGRILPTTSVDEFGSELARWFGVPAADLPAVFPNASRFFDVVSEPHPLGFMAVVQDPPQGDSVEVIQSCFGTPSRGRFDVQVTNNSDRDNDYVVKLTGLSKRIVSIGAGRTGGVTFTARRDGVYTVDVTHGLDLAPFYTSGEMVVDCFVPVPWEIATSCLSGRGRIDLWIENTTANQAAFETTYNHARYGPIIKVLDLDPGEIQRMTVTGRQYGTWTVKVKNLLLGQEVFSGQVDILCGAPQLPVVIRNSCLLTGPPVNKGRVDVDLWNQTPSTRYYEVVVTRPDRPLSSLARQVTLNGDQRDTVTVTGRPHVIHNVEVWETDGVGGIRINLLASETIKIDC